MADDEGVCFMCHEKIATLMFDVNFRLKGQKRPYVFIKVAEGLPEVFMAGVIKV